MTSTPHSMARLQDISAAFYTGKIDRDEARSRVIDVVFARLACSRVSLWRFDGEADDLSLLCFAAKSAGGPLITTGSTLRGAEYRDYFAGLVKNGTYVVADAMADPNLQPMRSNYLLPNRVRSMLDAAVMVNGRAYGMVCCEQTDAMRQWRVDEIAALRAITGKLALLMAGAADAALRASPSLPLAPIYVFS
jgi:GAF domain-containing protein